MKKDFFICIATLFVVAYAHAVPASPEPFLFTQPDGTVLTLHTVGDEYCHWTETADKQVVILSNNGYYEYASILNSEIVPSGIKVSGTNLESQISNANNTTLRNQIIDLMWHKRDNVIVQMDSILQVEATIDEDNSAVPMVKTTSSVSLTEGNQKVLCILIGFPDKPFTKSKTDFENMWNQTNYNVEGSQGSIKDFYAENSYGHMNVTATVVGPYIAKNNSSYYATGSDIIGSKVRDLVKEALTAAKNDIQFKDFDINGDKYVDAVHIVFAGYACDADQTKGLIWSHHWSLSTAVKQGTYKAKQYFITSELAGGSGTKIAPIGTVCHEYGHNLGAPDYYSKTDYSGTGHWDVMAKGSWNGATGNHGRCPAHHNPYTKAYIYHWVTPMIINSSVSNVTYTLTPSHNTTSIYRINTSTNNEFFLLENKAAVSNTFNSWLPGMGGLIIYHIHSDIANAISNQNVNNSHPQKCYIVCANATSNPNSSAPSYGTTGIECAYPYLRKIFFTSNSTPSATSWAGSATGVDLCFIQKSGNNIKFVANPKINGPDILSTQATYSVSNIPASATIKWTYTFTPYNSYPVLRFDNPVIFVNGDSTSTILVERGKRPVFRDSTIIGPISPRDSMVMMPLSASTQSLSYVYFSGTAVLKATITSGDYSYVITKTVSLTSASTTLMEASNDIESCMLETESNAETDIDNKVAKVSYQLRYQNPVLTNSTTIFVEQFSDFADCYIPYEGTYKLEIWNDRLGLIQRIEGQNDTLNLDCGNLPNGIYQMVLFVNGQCVSNSKMLKL